jgi:hypothetical protein
MRFLIFLAFLATCCFAQADCSSNLSLKGIITVENCYPSNAKCGSAEKTLYQYMATRKDDDPSLLVIGLHGSPWHVYDPDYHIIEMDELVGIIKQQGPNIKRVVLLASWSGVAPDQHGKSLAQKLSAALGGMPVDGENGFVWFSKDGAVHTTQQAFTIVKGGPYWAKEGDKVMASLVAGWPVQLEAQFAKTHDADGMMRAGVGFDVYMLCPTRALVAFEAGAALSNPVAAFNAAIMRLERGEPGDKESAIALLNKSAALGDKKAQAKLKSLAHTAQ